MQLLIKLFFFMVLFISVNGVRPFLPLGELENDLYVYPMLSFVGFSMLLGLKLQRNTNRAIILLMSLMIVMFVSLLVNYDSILVSKFKGKSGFTKAVLQLAMYGFYLFLVNAMFNLSRYNDLKKVVEKAYVYGFVIFMSFACVEILSWIIEPINTIFDAITGLWRDSRFVRYTHSRLRGSLYEAPSAAMFLLIVLPWLVLLGKNKVWSRIFPFLGIIFLWLTVSRTGIIVGIGSVVGVFVLVKRMNKTVFVICLGVLLVFTAEITTGGIVSKKLESMASSLSVDEDSYHQASNAQRFATQIATWEVVKQYPIFGCGFGQLGFKLSDHYPDWSLKFWNVKKTIDEDDPTWPPSFNFYLRVLAELGFVGFFIFLFVIIYLIYIHRRNYLVTGSNFDLCLLINSITCSALFMQYGSYRFLPFWVCVMFAYKKEAICESD